MAVTKEQITNAKHGVLCKTQSGNVHLITGLANGKYQDATTPNGNAYDKRNLTPLTAAEWWEFAPWQDMETVPESAKGILVKNERGDAWLISYSCGIKTVSSANNAIAWLPLPTGDL